MKKEKYYQRLLDRIAQSYHDRIVIVDTDNLLRDVELRRILDQSFAVCFYHGELSLRTFLETNRQKRVVVIRQDESYFPHDIEATSEIISLRKKELVRPQIPSDRHDDLEEASSQLERLLKSDVIPWLEVAPLWGKFAYVSELANESYGHLKYEESLEKGFTAYILNHYRDIFFQSHLNSPITVDKVLAFLGYQEGEKKVLLCFDCLGFEEWYCLKEFLMNRQIKNFRETAIYTLLPSVTSISRCALLTGERELKSLNTERKGFHNFVQDNWPLGQKKGARLFINAEPKVRSEYFEYDYVGLIFNFIDKLAHAAQGVKGSKRLMLQNLKEILPDTEIHRVILRYLEEGYRVYIGSDHGSVWGEGIGINPGKYMVEEKAKRAALYPNKILARELLERDPELIAFEHKETLGDNVAIFPPSRKMYGDEGHYAVSHGGIHIEEAIVPFVEVLS